MRWLSFFALGIVVLFGVGAVLARRLPFETRPTYVVTFSSSQAKFFGYDPEELFIRILNDLQPSHVRLQANWNAIEPEPGRFDFQELDRLIALAKSHNAEVTLAVGRKLPRWPECHDPAWLYHLPATELDDKLLMMLKEVVIHYRNEPAVVRWQLENEPFFSFGNCPAPNTLRLKRERDLVRSYDSKRPILVTDSGELSPWFEAAHLGDQVGATLYRVTWSPIFGYFSYPWPAYFYRLKAGLVSPFVAQVVVSELQLEPWAPRGLKALSDWEINSSLSLKKFIANIRFFQKTGLREAFLWGTEWWYYANDELGKPEYLLTIQDLMLSDR